MTVNLNQLILAIHSTDDHFGFAYRENNNNSSDKFFIKKFDKDLCNNLVADLSKFFPKDNFKKVYRITVSIGPANFNASRMIVVLARNLSQQINCSLDSFSCFQLMAKRIALDNNLFEKNQSFWIFKRIKRRGYIAGQYKICIGEEITNNFFIKETIEPRIFKQLSNIQPTFEAVYDVKKDLEELLYLSNKNSQQSIYNSWDKVLPLYPLSPIN